MGGGNVGREGEIEERRGDIGRKGDWKGRNGGMQ